MRSMLKNVELLGQNICNWFLKKTHIIRINIKSAIITKENKKGNIMEEKNELNDIILNKGNGASGNKKIILAIATLGIILVIVVLLMNTLTSNGTNNLPQAVLPPEPKAKVADDVNNEPLFEEVEVLDEETQNNNNLDKIAQRLKEESMVEEVPAEMQKIEPVQKPVTKVTPKVQEAKKAVVKKEQPVKKQASTAKSYYIQVGSFSKYEPNKKFLSSITSKGFKYKYHKVVRNSKTLNKVLVGPFESEIKARDALRTIRSSVEAGAFIVKI